MCLCWILSFYVMRLCRLLLFDIMCLSWLLLFDAMRLCRLFFDVTCLFRFCCSLMSCACVKCCSLMPCACVDCCSLMSRACYGCCSCTSCACALKPWMVSYTTRELLLGHTMCMYRKQQLLLKKVLLFMHTFRTNIVKNLFIFKSFIRLETNSVSSSSSAAAAAAAAAAAVVEAANHHQQQ